ncbi:AAA family ATPase [Devosia sp. MC1541]|uniref:AAA family ATPase n=1 Tax=Devosia sp. MC1541 TaxID=2725264 RepID=UPI0020BEE195|nr:AAA family ATPase [Devosia sp. MC1541]
MNQTVAQSNSVPLDRKQLQMHGGTMLENLQIAQVASYPAAGIPLNDLRAVNFLFGTNGSGKTSISRLIADANAPAHGNCTMGWKNNQPLETFVYNSNFVEHNFTPQMRGIFTLGEVAREKSEAIEQARAKVTDALTHIAQLEGTLGDAAAGTGKQGDLAALRQQFENECWTLKTTYDAAFKEAFERARVRGARAKFCDKVLEEKLGNSANLSTFAELQTRAATVYAEGVLRVALLPAFDTSELRQLGSDPILAKKVVGREDIDIAALVRKLGNSDWVRTGLDYVEKAGDPCPFCQKPLEDDLLGKLRAFFDEAYGNDMLAVGRLVDAHAIYADRCRQYLDDITENPGNFLDVAIFRVAADRLKSLLLLNAAIVERKRKEPSAPLAMESLEGAIAEIDLLLSTANEQANRHNALVDNLATEKASLSTDIWRFLIEEKKDLIDRYLSDKRGLDGAVTGISARLATLKTELQTAQEALVELERGVTSVRPAVTKINNTLASFGFNSFQLDTAGDRGQLYKIVRADGSDARDTLSEGERSFITFLYFYHLIQGSISESGTQSDRVVVFDDPVSSLDSDVLFIVSALVKRVLDEATTGTGRIKQAFVLTHNIYFHKEVTYNSRRPKGGRLSSETFWIVRKREGVSTVEKHETNPVRTSYELLWSEVRNPNRSTVTIQNVLRRILEYYFTILGNMDKDDVINRFEGRDQQVCSSLFSWINDGSHNFTDDVYVSADAETVERYLRVFKRIFDETNHQAHYAMMIGDEDPVTAAIAEVVLLADVAGTPPEPPPAMSA